MRQIGHNKTKKLLFNCLIDFRKLLENAKVQKKIVSNINNKNKTNLDKNKEVEDNKDRNKTKFVEKKIR